jgi:hypothetical protein
MPGLEDHCFTTLPYGYPITKTRILEQPVKLGSHRFQEISFCSWNNPVKVVGIYLTIMQLDFFVQSTHCQIKLGGEGTPLKELTVNCQ